ncbi:hypothetical protein FRX31_023146 [Thalictrum thalictroides]|uniref:C2H2-type domain-containing protein n=1 Tax=Thalictrum thalictroides TaxID=46969 RepID=A0A7J6VSR0_THATH|nr:hypothetical protein FRX31_023146 [Thalictrum thalictroides]
MAREGEKVLFSSDTSTLAIHTSTTNADTGTSKAPIYKSYDCKVCDIKFSNDQVLSEHIKFHVLGKSFANMQFASFRHNHGLFVSPMGIIQLTNSRSFVCVGLPRQSITPQSLICKGKREIRILGFTVLTDDESEGREGSSMTPMMGTAQADADVGREHCLYEGGEKGEKPNTEVQELDLTLKL